MASKPKGNKPAAKSAKGAADTLQGKSTAVAVHTPMQLPAGFTAKRALQLPSLVMKTQGEQRILIFMGNMEVSTVKPKPNEAPATVAAVVDPTTGEQFKFLVPAVVESTLCDVFGPSGHQRPDRKDLTARAKLYADTDLIHKAFAIRNCGKREGKRHVDFEVVEVDGPTISPAK